MMVLKWMTHESATPAVETQNTADNSGCLLIISVIVAS